MEVRVTPQDTAELTRVSGLPDVSREELKKWYGLMHLGRVLDDKAPNYLMQGLGWSYHAPCAGHDAIQLALGMTFRPGRDYLFPYYRDLTTCVAAGTCPTTSPSHRSASRTSPPACRITHSTRWVSRGRSRPTARTPSSSPPS